MAMTWNTRGEERPSGLELPAGDENGHERDGKRDNANGHSDDAHRLSKTELGASGTTRAR
jgi:hypothetical protein